MTESKKQLAFFSLILLGLTLTLSLSACTDEATTESINDNADAVLEDNIAEENKESIDVEDEYIIADEDFVNAENLIKNIIQTELSQEVQDGLIQMREEEKLARDVYIKLGEKWGTRSFTNISKSEQTHTDAIKTLLERYDIADPVTNDEVGVFTSDLVQNLYNDLVEQGSKSELDALIVGATIEDLDIKDLNELTIEGLSEDIEVVYNNLNSGSKNHMRAFIKQIERSNGEYTAQFISQEELTEITATSNSRWGRR